MWPFQLSSRQKNLTLVVSSEHVGTNWTLKNSKISFEDLYKSVCIFLQSPLVVKLIVKRLDREDHWLITVSSVKEIKIDMWSH